jgi:hypothetical protein
MNVFFICGQTSSVRIAKFGIRKPLKKICKISFGQIKDRFYDRLGVNGAFEFFFSIHSVEEKLKQNQMKKFYLTYNESFFKFEGSKVEF